MSYYRIIVKRAKAHTHTLGFHPYVSASCVWFGLSFVGQHHDDDDNNNHNKMSGGLTWCNEEVKCLVDNDRKRGAVNTLSNSEDNKRSRCDNIKALLEPGVHKTTGHLQAPTSYNVTTAVNKFSPLPSGSTFGTEKLHVFSWIECVSCLIVSIFERK